MVFTEVLGHEVRYDSVSPNTYRGFGFPGAETLGNMFQLMRDFEDYFCGVRDPNFARSLNPSLQSFKMWLTQNKSAFPLERVASAPDHANELIRDVSKKGELGCVGR